MDEAPSLPQLQQSLRRLHWLVAGLSMLLLGLAAVTAWLLSQRDAPLHVDHLSTRQLQVLDEHGVVRVEIGQDSAEDGRRAPRAS